MERPRVPPRPRGGDTWDHMIIYAVLGWVRRGTTPSADLDPIEVNDSWDHMIIYAVQG